MNDKTHITQNISYYCLRMCLCIQIARTLKLNDSYFIRNISNFSYNLSEPTMFISCSLPIVDSFISQQWKKWQQQNDSYSIELNGRNGNDNNVSPNFSMETIQVFSIEIVIVEVRTEQRERGKEAENLMKNLNKPVIIYNHIHLLLSERLTRMLLKYVIEY